MTGHEIRIAFRDFFVKRGHAALPSDSLVPKTDPTLLFTSAGMVQFKPYFLGQKGDELNRATTCQKCLRTSDLENVGRTARHHTFFEMLGNFSFGDYFKEDAIQWGWELSTEVFGLDKSRLWVSVFEDDDEAEKIWVEKAGVSRDRIVRLGEEDNFWKMGETGPCGPCSEIHYDQGPEVGCGKPDCSVACDCDRYLEFYNLVFTQFDRQADGTLEPLARKNIDTGMGLERVTALIQGVFSNYETDLFKPMFDKIRDMSGIAFGDDPRTDTAMRVLADHARATLFAFMDGITPANTGRGYVIKRILRRALRQGKVLGLDFPFFTSVMDSVVEVMKPAYPELTEDNVSAANRMVEQEEENFKSILSRGGDMLYSRMEEIKASGGTEFPGKVAFQLYDTYGFPFELTLEILEDEGFSCSREEFEKEMKEQRERARKAWKGSGATDRIALDASGNIPATEFVGYEQESSEAKVLAIWDGSRLLDSAEKDCHVEIVLDQTPFYAESGGQVGDQGEIASDSGRFHVEDTQKTASGLVVHIGTVKNGIMKTGQTAKAEVNADRRGRIRRNHTTTHLLHAALHHIVGSEAKQAGSKVDDTGFRFDFTSNRQLTRSELRDVEELVNEYVVKNLPVNTTVTSLENAMAEGAVALFDEKYEDTVRLIEVPGVSKELCGGTHAERTGDIGSFQIVSEGSVSAGVRRLEAITGVTAWAHVQEKEDILDEVCQSLKSKPDDLIERVKQLQDQVKSLEKQLEKERSQQAVSNVDTLLDEREALSLKGAEVQLLRKNVPGCSADDMNKMLDLLRDKGGEGIYVLATESDGKAIFVCAVSPSLTKNFPAGKIVKEVAKITGGGGGGRPDRAQAGGKDASKVAEALAKLPEILASL